MKVRTLTNINKCLAATTSLLLLGGCAFKREVTITSSPSGAEITKTSDHDRINFQNFPIGKTPLTTELVFGVNHNHGPTMYNLTLSKDGYESKTVQVYNQSKESKSIHVNLSKIVVKEII
jgi:hypothetical protein